MSKPINTDDIDLKFPPAEQQKPSAPELDIEAEVEGETMFGNMFDEPENYYAKEKVEEKEGEGKEGEEKDGDKKELSVLEQLAIKAFKAFLKIMGLDDKKVQETVDNVLDAINDPEKQDDLAKMLSQMLGVDSQKSSQNVEPSASYAYVPSKESDKTPEPVAIDDKSSKDKVGSSKTSDKVSTTAPKEDDKSADKEDGIVDLLLQLMAAMGKALSEQFAAFLKKQIASYEKNSPEQNAAKELSAKFDEVVEQQPETETMFGNMFDEPEDYYAKDEAEQKNKGGVDMAKLTKDIIGVLKANGVVAADDNDKSPTAVESSQDKSGKEGVSR